MASDKSDGQGRISDNDGAKVSVEQPGSQDRTLGPRKLEEEDDVQDQASAPDKGRRRRGQSVADLCRPQRQTQDGRVPWAIAAAALTMLGVGTAAFVFVRPQAAPTWDLGKILAMRDAEKPKEVDVATWLADLQAAQKRPSPWTSTVAAQERSDAHQASGAQQARQKRPRKSTSAPAHASISPPILKDSIDPLYAQRYGSARRIAAASARPASVGAAAAPRGQKRTNLRGAEASARLLDEISSDQVGAPVKAILTQSIKLAAVTLPQNTGLEGAITGGSDSRVHVAFDMARTLDGTVVRFDAIARDRSKGTAGIEGHRQITHETAKSVGLAGVGRMISSGGRIVGGRLGEIAGNGIEAMADSSGQASQRLDRDQPTRVVAPQGAPFKLYIRAMLADDDVAES